MRFSKWHAHGNSYLLVEQTELGADEARRLSAEHETDGVLQVVAVEGNRAEIVIWNPDGSTAEMSGNGTRIAARWLADETGAEAVTIAVGAREVAAQMLEPPLVKTDLGEVSVGEPEEVAGLEVTAVSVGNPHAVVIGDPAEVAEVGPLLETHPRFPNRTNVQVVRVDGPHALTIGIWERGAGETTASGSSAAAAAAAAIARGWCESPVRVQMRGGSLEVWCEGLSNSETLSRFLVMQVGPAERMS